MFKILSYNFDIISVDVWTGGITNMPIDSYIIRLNKKNIEKFKNYFRIININYDNFLKFY